LSSSAASRISAATVHISVLFRRETDELSRVALAPPSRTRMIPLSERVLKHKAGVSIVSDGDLDLLAKLRLGFSGEAATQEARAAAP